MIRNRLYRIHQIVLFIIYISLMVFFIYKCLENGVASSESSAKVATISAEVINKISGKEKVNPSDPSFQSFIRKFIGHYSYFVFLGFISTFFYLSFRKKFKDWILLIISFSIGIVFAVISEFLLEANTSGRGASWSDVGIDVLGFITLSIIIVIIYYIVIFRKKKVNE